jgi:hypothetical protein
MADDKRNFKLPVFKGSGFSDWKFKLMAYVGSEVADHLTERTTIFPDNPVFRLAYEKCRKMMIESLQDEALDVASGCGETASAKVMYKALCDKYQSQSVSTRLSTLQRLVGERKGKTSIDQYVAAKRKLYREELKDTVSGNEVLIGSIVAGLPASYNDFVAKFLAGNDAATSDVDTLLKQLREHEKRTANS